jgi:hypothetical protein
MEASVSYWLNQVQRASVQRQAAAPPALPSVGQLQGNAVVDESSKED